MNSKWKAVVQFIITVLTALLAAYGGSAAAHALL